MINRSYENSVYIPSFSTNWKLLKKTELQSKDEESEEAEPKLDRSDQLYGLCDYSNVNTNFTNLLERLWISEKSTMELFQMLSQEVDMPQDSSQVSKEIENNNTHDELKNNYNVISFVFDACYRQTPFKKKQQEWIQLVLQRQLKF